MTTSTMTEHQSHRFCVAPMLDCTDRHERFLLRQISQHAFLYTEMVTSNALLFGKVGRFLNFNLIEQPVALQLGGSVPQDMAKCAELAQSWGYNEVNINVGCPSDRVQSGFFGACLMKEPDLVAKNVKQMVTAVDIPITVKTRIGVDEQEPEQALWSLVEKAAQAGCNTFIVHARKAWLKGLSPRQNRNVPPLQYELVYQLKQDFPELNIVINGGIDTIQACQQHLKCVDGVMMGREAYRNPYILSDVDEVLFQDVYQKLSRYEILQRYIEYLSQQMSQHHRLTMLCKHVIGLFQGQPGGKIWRRYISEHAHLNQSTETVLLDAYEYMQQKIQ